MVAVLRHLIGDGPRARAAVGWGATATARGWCYAAPTLRRSPAIDACTSRRQQEMRRCTVCASVGMSSGWPCAAAPVAGPHGAHHALQCGHDVGTIKRQRLRVPATERRTRALIAAYSRASVPMCAWALARAHACVRGLRVRARSAAWASAHGSHASANRSWSMIAQPRLYLPRRARAACRSALSAAAQRAPLARPAEHRTTIHPRTRRGGGWACERRGGWAGGPCVRRVGLEPYGPPACARTRGGTHEHRTGAAQATARAGGRLD